MEVGTQKHTSRAALNADLDKSRVLTSETGASAVTTTTCT